VRVTTPKSRAKHDPAIPEAARPPVREVERVVAGTQEAQFVSLEDADAEARGEKKPGGEPEAEDEVEPDGQHRLRRTP
jgi:hypothetical protein